MFDISAYISRITAEHADKPKFVSFVTALVAPLIDAQDLFGTLLTTFDLDSAIGVQLDAVGQWVGRSRDIITPFAGVYFSLDTEGLGFDQGNWQGQFDPTTGITKLDDQTYRQLLKAKVIMNSWDGTIAQAALALAELFGHDPSLILSIQDNQDMTMTVAIGGASPPAILLSLLQGGYVPIKPEGVLINFGVPSIVQTALFGFDVENESIQGFDHGSWSGQPGVPSGPVSGFALTSFTDTTASFAWIPPITGTGPFTYQLQYSLGPNNGPVFILAGPPTSNTQGTISGLTAGQTYTATVFPINSLGAGPVSGPITFTTAVGIPGQVTGLQITGTTATSITLSWSTLLGNQIVYQVQFRLTGQTTFTSFNGATTGLTMTVTGLTPSTSYDFQVFAQNSQGAGPPSAIVTGGTTGAVPGVIQNLAASNPTQSSVDLTWDQPITNNGPYTYTVQFAQNVQPVTFQNFTGTVTVTSTGGLCTVTGITGGTNYLFRVFATNGAGNGPVSDPVSATTASTGPDQVTGLVVSNITATSVDLSWNTAAGATTYQVEQTKQGNPVFANSGSPVSGLTTTVSGLSPGTAYNFRVHGINSGGVSGLPSLQVAVVTVGNPPGQVPSLTVTGVADTSVSLQWTVPAAGTGTNVYQVQYRLSGQQPFTSFATPTVQLNTTVTGLQSGQQYEFIVFAINDFGTGSPSPVATATTTGGTGTSTVTWSPTDHTPNIVLSNGNLTATSITPPVTGMTAASITASGLTLNWAAPATAGYYAIRGTSSQTTGRFYVEYTLTDSTVDFAVGIANTSWGTQGSAAPQPVTNIQLSSSTTTSITVTWTASPQTLILPPVTNVLLGSATSSSLTINWTASGPIQGGGSGGTGAGQVPLGADINSLGIYPNSPPQAAKVNGQQLTTGGAADITGHTVSLALDFSAQMFWFTTQAMRTAFGANAWNNSSTASPANSTGGLSMAALTPGAYFPAFGDLEASSSCTINTGASSFVVGLPQGYTAWGGGGAAAITPPGAISGLVVTQTTQSSVPLTWVQPTAGSPATSYQVQYRKTGTSLFYWGPRVTTTSAVVIDLLASTQYDFQVTPSNQGGTGVTSQLISATTIAPTSPLLAYRGLNIKGSDLTAINQLPAAFPHVNAVVIPVFCSTGSQTSTDVAITVTLNTVGSWIDAAVSAGFEVFLAVYVTPRDGSPMQTITPGPDLNSVAQFMANFQAVCAQVAQLGSQHNAQGMFCGVELQPWAGSAADTGPFSQVHNSQWQAVYAACKSAWPSGIISYAALQSSLGLTTPTSPWTIDWAIWDAVAIDLYPGSSNSITLTADFSQFFETQADPDQATEAATGQVPLFTALQTYSTNVGRKIIINQCGIIPADGNQIGPGSAHALPPPFDFPMQNAWWQAILGELTIRLANFSGFFAWDGGVNNFNSPFNGVNYWGIQSTPSAATVDNAFSALTGVAQQLQAPTNLRSTAVTTTTVSVAWNAIAGTNITYVVQFAIGGTNTFSSLAETSNLTQTITNLSPNTSYDIKVFGKQGTLVGPASSLLRILTQPLGQPTIVITDPGQQTAGQAFTISGTLTGFTAAPALLYVDDPSLTAVPNITESQTTNSITLNWGSVTPITPVAFPTGSNITTATFSFQHPALPAGTHNLTVTNNTISSTQITLTVVSPQVVGIVTGVHVTATTSTTITLSWTAPS